MAGRITELAALTAPVAADLIEVVDVSDTSMAATGTNKKLTLATLSSRNVVAYGTSTTGVLTDAGSYLRFTGSSLTYTIPPNSTVAFPIGTQIDGVGTSAAMTLIAGAGVTINKARTLVTVAADSGWSAIKVGTDEWDCHGDFV